MTMKPRLTRRHLLTLGGLSAIAAPLIGAEVAIEFLARSTADPSLGAARSKAFLVFLYKADHGRAPDQTTLNALYDTFIERQVQRQVDTARLHRRTAVWLDSNVGIEGLENLKLASRLAKERNTGVVIGTTHTGSFVTGRTRLAQELQHMGHDVDVIQQTQGFSANLLHRMIAWRFGMNPIEYSPSGDKGVQDTNRQAALDEGGSRLASGSALFVDADLEIVNPSVGNAVQLCDESVSMPLGPVDAAGGVAPIVVMGSRREEGKTVVRAYDVLDPWAMPLEQLRQQLADDVEQAWRQSDTVFHTWGYLRQRGETIARAAGLSF